MTECVGRIKFTDAMGLEGKYLGLELEPWLKSLRQTLIG